MKKLKNKFKHLTISINTTLAIVFMAMIIATIEVIGAYFTRQLEQNSIENFQSSIQVLPIVSNQLSAQLLKDDRHTNSNLNRIVGDYSNGIGTISEIIVVDNKDIIRAVSNLNDKKRIGQRVNNTLVKQVTSTGRQATKVINDHGDFMIQVTPLTAGNGSANTVGAIYVRASMQGVFNDLRNISLMFLVTSLIAAVMGAILSLVVSHAITKPIEEMQSQALNIADGDYSSQVKIYSNDELGQLGQAFNTLSVRIERSQEESESEQRRLDSVLSHMSDGVLATDRHGNVNVVNQMALSFLNTTEDQIINKPIASVLGLDETSQDLIASQKGIVLTVNQGTRDEVILHASFSLIKRVTGFVSGSVCVLHDITEQQKNENSQKQFVSNVSHELRTPLTSLHAYIETLNEGAWKDPKIAPQFLQVTQEETERMIRMINELLSLSRMDRGVSKVDVEWVNFNDFVSHILDRFDMIVKTDTKEGKKKYTIKRNLSSQALWVEIDTDKFAQVIDNIMNNAIKYSPDGGVITIKLRQERQQIILSIADQGLGIPREDLSKIFDRFYRVDKARSREQGGTGLGLAIAKEIVEEHHGKIWANSSEGKGSTFYIALPYEPMSEGDDWDEV
ncbi:MULTISPECIES: cell wall metabolism sensor histidine kinase WalK [Lactobacillus]|uniref:cell wall metabolism sensor histidine kinase WalK n=1 Tax=Lactobacillus TaxID=1578 RepID=UPI001C69C81E|nr:MULTISPECIES: cell wall metabolism sensor histidine kinase WalK [Lactobacillus]MCX8721924.1 cell wall metabolism sensor histidine kinase WalK [Lactobacillus sp. B4010]MCX8723697.1 cell wall metabolism sensor histidine kinase WalK [Lactobacillus sp. B4005]MCX8731639.1 cell wall metabolism sensor histidine kinase WalK [Lactobacillus sp. B4015]MCX8734087.1 cell wall metabolism sensor histidine kinase WalK [Lactobacillus sp. B4012]QYN55781.1 cell wall metabolism sensor histidine kinase WalK [La